jgi:UDP-glucose 6-dehydrogenase
MKIGFIGQGWIGRHYADNYESRGFEVVRYAKEESFEQNADAIKQCKIVIIAVPTPTVGNKFDDSILRSVIPMASKGSTVVIKSTLIIGKTLELANDFGDYFIMHSPEFLSERTAKEDVDNPHAGILGIPFDTEEYKQRAQEVMATFPTSPYNKVCNSGEAELIKYSRNIHGFFEIVFYNMFYDLANNLGLDYEVIKEYIKHDPLHVYRYASPVHASGHNINEPKRGAGGHCFIKDFKAFSEFAIEKLNDEKYTNLLKSLEAKNLYLLINSSKDLDLIEDVYGKEILNQR